MLVLTRSSPTNLIITAQDSRNIHPHSLRKGPKIQPKHRPIINHGIHHLTAPLLLVANVTLRAYLESRQWFAPWRRRRGTSRCESPPSSVRLARIIPEVRTRDRG
jgi:hypothetical protein